MSHEEDGHIVVAEKKPKLKKPKKYVVLLHNDDYTTMEFVVEVLVRFFQKKPDEATKITMEVHQNGKGVAGIYPFEIAEMKTHQVMELARSRGFPLRCSMEPTNDSGEES